MSELRRLFDPRTVAIAGLSGDESKHGRRVLRNLRKLGFGGQVWGVNPKKPDVEGIHIVGSVRDLPTPPDVVVCATPAAKVPQIAEAAEGAAALIVFAGGFGETGEAGMHLEEELIRSASRAGVRVLGPNSGGLIRPGCGLAASFLTCLDRPGEEIRSGPVGLVTQSGGTGSYIHNLAAARGSGLAISVSTGNEVDIKLGEALDATISLPEVKSLLVLIETIRDGESFIRSLQHASSCGKPVVACRLGTGGIGKRIMSSHTGAMAMPDAVLDGVLDSLGVVVAATPAEAYEVAEMMARSGAAGGGRVGIVAHSGGIAIHLADLAEQYGVALPRPSARLARDLAPLLDHGASDNPLDMGGIIGGPARFSEIVATMAGSGEYDALLAVSTAHPPEHSAPRVEALMSLQIGLPLLHLWMAGDQAQASLRALRAAGVPVTEEPRAAMRALSGLARAPETAIDLEPVSDSSESVEDWGLPLVPGEVAVEAREAVALADQIGYPVVAKVVAPGLAHKVEVGGVRLGLGSAEEVNDAFQEILDAAKRHGLSAEGVRIEPFRPGLEMIVGGIRDPVFGPLVSVGLGGTYTELLGDVVYAPAPVDLGGARRLIDRISGRAILEGFRGSQPADVEELAHIIRRFSHEFVGAGAEEAEINPLVWDGSAWVGLDWLIVMAEIAT